MFSNIAGAAAEVHTQLVGVYWILLTPVVVVTILLQFLKAKNEALDPSDLLRRVVVSILLLISIDYVVNGVASLSDLITAKISQDNSVWEFLEKLGPNYQNPGSSGTWFDLKEHAIYLLSLVCYMVAYLGFFVSEALVSFVWTVLYAVSPLMILAFVSKASANVTINLYKGLVTVAIWRILFACLGALLLNVEISPENAGLDDWLLTAVTNLCIGLSMLLIPLFTRSLISDGLAGAAATLSATASLASVGMMKAFAVKRGRKLTGLGPGSSENNTKLRNQFSGRRQPTSRPRSKSSDVRSGVAERSAGKKRDTSSETKRPRRLTSRDMKRRPPRHVMNQKKPKTGESQRRQPPITNNTNHRRKN